jgi:hypothetical protein
MKTTDFIKEGIGEDAHAMHQDHEVQMARSDCYNAAKYAIELHKMLHHIGEQQGLDGWVSEKITLANDYLRTVWEYLRHDGGEEDTLALPEFTFESAEAQMAKALNEKITVVRDPGQVRPGMPQGRGDVYIPPNKSVSPSKSPEKTGKLKQGVAEGMDDDDDLFADSDRLENMFTTPAGNMFDWQYSDSASDVTFAYRGGKITIYYDNRARAFDLEEVWTDDGVARDVVESYIQQHGKWLKKDEVAIGKLIDQIISMKKQGMAEGEEHSPVANAVTRRIMLQRSDLLAKYGPEKVMAAIDSVADFAGDVEEIGSSDVSAWVNQVERELASMPESKKPVSEMTAGGTGAGGFATGPTGGSFKKTTGVPKKVGNVMKRIAPKLGKGIY